MEEQIHSSLNSVDCINLPNAVNKDDYPFKKFRVTFFLLFILLSCCTRLYGISRGPTVVWDEAHFGKFGSYYLNHTFYTDVHPPLGKMLIGLAGYLSNYNGSYTFPSGELYPTHINYISMRMYVAILGSLSIPLIFLSCLNLDMDKWTSVFVSFCLIFDNGLIGISRLILLDSILLFFTSLTVFALSVYLKNRHRPFSLKWWLSLLFTGISIGLVSSVKWVGFFVTALVGCHAICELWAFYGDIRISKARPGDAQMSSRFQAHLKGNEISKSSINIAYGSKVTLRSMVKSGGLLHSHPLLYPIGSGLQQITAYHHKDANNYWIIEKPHQPIVAETKNETLLNSNLNIKLYKDHLKESLSNENTAIDSEDENPPELLKSGDIIRLIHLATGRNLHSHFGSFAYMTKSDLEVSGYGNYSRIPDQNDHWIVEVIGNVEKKHTSNTVKNILTLVRFKHAITGCYLATSKGSLPDWASNQQEVSCEFASKPVSKGNKQLTKNTIWNFETNYHPKLPKGSASLYRSNFFNDFLEINSNMWHMNNALVKDEEIEPSPLTSNPLQWPFLTTGIRMTSFEDGVTKFYMLGNPVVWWLGAWSIIGIILLILVKILWTARNPKDSVNSDEYSKTTELTSPIMDDPFWMKCRVALLGWFLHFIPFFLMGRVLYLHHYYPALIFSVMCTGILIDSIEKEYVRKNVTCILACIVFAVFLKFTPICYGMFGPIDDYHSLKWLNSWNL